MQKGARPEDPDAFGKFKREGTASLADEVVDNGPSKTIVDWREMLREAIDQRRLKWTTMMILTNVRGKDASFDDDFFMQIVGESVGRTEVGQLGSLR